MWKKGILVLAALGFAFSILLLSVFRSASTKYHLNSNNFTVPDSQVLEESKYKIEYELPFPGKVLPDSPFWELKAIRDRLWLMVNNDSTKEVELLLLFADKRLGSAYVLFDRKNAEGGLSILIKAEKYLEEAASREEKAKAGGLDTSDLLYKLANASLKHYEVIQTITIIAPDSAKPQIGEIQKYSQKAFETTRNSLLDLGKKPPENPFNW